MLGPHANFIVASYAIVVGSIAALIGWIARDYLAQTRKLHDLERSGVMRRSGRGATDPQ